jgi:hypothetical protein
MTVMASQFLPGTPAKAASAGGQAIATVMLIPEEDFVLRKPSIKKNRDKKDRLIVKKGDELNFAVKHDVWHDGELLISRGTPAVVKVSDAKGRKVAGVKAHMTLTAVNTTDVNGREIPLLGSTQIAGRSRIALAVTLCLLVSWPLIFIHGGRAKSDRVPVALEATAIP